MCEEFIRQHGRVYTNLHHINSFIVSSYNLPTVGTSAISVRRSEFARLLVSVDSCEHHIPQVTIFQYKISVRVIDLANNDIGNLFLNRCNTMSLHCHSLCCIHYRIATGLAPAYYHTCSSAASDGSSWLRRTETVDDVSICSILPATKRSSFKRLPTFAGSSRDRQAC